MAATTQDVTLVFLFGPPACGKLTVGRELAARTGFRLFHNHLTVDLLGSVFAFGSEPFVALREEIWLGVFRAAARQGISLIFTFAPEKTVTTGFPQQAREVIEAEGGRPLYVELKCAGEELARRMESPERRQFGKVASVAQYRELALAGAFEFPSIAADLEVDTGVLSPLEAVTRIEQAVSAASSSR